MNGVIFQCAACRALTTATSVAVDGPRAGLVCSACGALSMLPVVSASSRSGARVVDVDVGSDEPRGPISLPPSTALAPFTPSSAPTPSFASSSSPARLSASSSAAISEGLSDDVIQRVREKIAGMGPPVEAQVLLAASFDTLLTKWGSAADHKRMLAASSQSDQLAFIGQRYRAVLDANPSDPQAKQAQNEIMTLAMAQMSARKDFGAVESSGAGKNVQIVAVAILAIAVALIGIWAVPRLLPPANGAATIEEPGSK